VLEQGGQYRPIAAALEGIAGRSVQQLAGLSNAERRGGAFAVVGNRPLHAVDRIAGDRVALAEIVEQGRERRELATDAGGCEFA
jgi:hypothetical protein